MRRTLTISAHKRPQYLRQVLEALRQCDGFKTWQWPTVTCDLHELQSENVAVAHDLGFTVRTTGRHLGCNQTIRSCFDYAINDLDSDFHVHLEDDTVPTKGCLRWFAWASENLHKLTVVSVLGYSHSPTGTASEYRLQQKDLSWGWGTWHSDWNTFFAPNWSPVGNEVPAWDTRIQQLLGTRMIAQPCISRIQNIGKDNGTYCLDNHTYENEHRSKQTTDQVVTEFSEASGNHPSKAA